jgi:hypothetical protein
VNRTEINGAPINGDSAADLLAAEQPPAGATWSLAVVVDGVDLSARCTDAVTVEATEGTARVASFVFVPGTGVVSWTAYMGRAVVITYTLRDALGDIVYERDVFHGVVELAEYDLNANLMRLRCTDGLQKDIDALDRNAIDLLTPGALYIERGDDELDGYAYLGERLKTLQASLDKDVAGTLVLTDWAPQTTPDLTITDADLYDGTLGIEVQRGRSATNQVTVSIGYRYERYHERHATGGWHWSNGIGDTFCDWLDETTELPDRAMIRSALESTGWVVLGLATDKLSPSGTYACPPWGPGQFMISEELRQQLAFGSEWVLGLRFTQQITEQYELTVQAPASIAQIGESTITLREALDNAIEHEAWGYETDKTAHGMIAASVRTDPEQGGRQLADNGDWFEDRIDIGPFPRAQADKALEMLLAMAAARIAEGHRNNAIVWDMPANPSIERYHSIAVATSRVTGRGKVRDVRHEFNITNGARTTTVRIAISSAHGSATFTPEALTIPAPPETGAVDPTGETPVSGMGKPRFTQIGGRIDSPDYDDDVDGFAGNYSNVQEESEPYPRRFAVTAPAVEDEARQAQSFTRAQSYQIAVREDPFTVTAP